ncbi:hypothetical protein [Butyrivibrio sp. INlla21]|uniref:hypothetical protein n=1 Tax=Butyrivibrio sp. INlla21 TaxID=1520811 RepID=UPI0008EB25D2|nr:hypothetical protein [Butyrivibrio sp. INlla21]SFU76919.1 hypothetical protein SAMN02910342_01683 [Butyrivibrio sp. INlla21]
MYQHKKNHIEINGNVYEFEFEIRTVIQYKENYIVLLTIPFNSKEINNIYCLDAEAKVNWRSEDIACKYPELKNLLPYEQMGLKEDKIYASDFYGRSFEINAETGKIEGRSIVK